MCIKVDKSMAWTIIVVVSLSRFLSYALNQTLRFQTLASNVRYQHTLLPEAEQLHDHQIQRTELAAARKDAMVPHLAKN